MHTEEIQRHSNGAIDIDFYRRRATAMRQQAQADAGNKLGGAMRAFFAGAVLALTGATLPARQSTPPLL